MRSGNRYRRLLSGVPAPRPIVAFGDSLTGATGVNKTEAYPVVAGALLGRRITRRQLGGQTSTQIAATQGGLALTGSITGDELPAATKGPVLYSRTFALQTDTTNASALGSATFSNVDGWTEVVCSATDTGLLLNQGEIIAALSICEVDFDIDIVDGFEIKVLGSQAAGTTNETIIKESGKFTIVFVPPGGTTSRIRFASVSGAQTFRLRNVEYRRYGTTGAAVTLTPSVLPWTTGNGSYITKLNGVSVLVRIASSTYTVYAIETAGAISIPAGSSLVWDEAVKLRNYTQWIWAGRNDVSTPNTVKANIALMVSYLPHAQYLIGSVLPASGDSAGVLSGLVTLNSDLAALYGPRFVDIYTLLRANGDGSANDNADIAAGLIPRSLRSDAVHLNAAGYALAAQAFVTANTAMGW